MTNIAMENHHAINGKIHYKWAIFHCYVSSPEGNCNLWWINVYHVCRQVTRHTAHLHDGSLPGRKIGGGAGRGVWCRNCRCRSDISEKWYFYILDLWNCDGERDMIYFYYVFLFYVISVVNHVEHHSFLQHLFAGCYGVPLLLQFQTGHWLWLWRETWEKQRLRLPWGGHGDVTDVRCMRQLNIIRDALKIWPSASTESWACLHWAYPLVMTNII